MLVAEKNKGSLVSNLVRFLAKELAFFKVPEYAAWLRMFGNNVLLALWGMLVHLPIKKTNTCKTSGFSPGEKLMIARALSL